MSETLAKHGWEPTQRVDLPKKPRPATVHRPRKGPDRVAPAGTGYFDAANIPPKRKPKQTQPSGEQKLSPGRQRHLEMLAQAGPALSDPTTGPIEVEGGFVAVID